ncbi:MAG: FAD:protein FMN transferase [Rhodoluna sp.]
MSQEFRHTEFCMGTVFRFVGRTDLAKEVLDVVIQTAVAELHKADEIFSLYKPDSPLSKLSRGECSVAECPEVVSQVWDECESWSEVTDGWFSSFTPQNTFDPSGLVKTWAADKAAAVLNSAGVTDFAMNAGGDIRLSRTITPGFAMRIGISTPVTIASPEAGVLTVVDLNNTEFRAVATSGTAERGEHIWNPKHGSAFANQVSQVTVVAKDIVTADVWATALFASGSSALTLADKYNERNKENQIAVLVVELDGNLVATSNFSSLLNPV